MASSSSLGVPLRTYELGPARQRLGHALFAAVRRKDHDVQSRMFGFEFRDQLEATAIRKFEIEQHDVGTSFAHQRERLAGACGRPRDRDIRGVLEIGDDAVAHDRVIVDDRDADHRNGRRAVTSVPPPFGRATIANEPPSVRARSAIPTTP